MPIPNLAATGRKLKAIRNQQVAEADRGAVDAAGNLINLPPLCEEFAQHRALCAGATGCTLPPKLLEERLIDYDTSAHPFREIVAGILGVDATTGLPELHQAEFVHTFLKQQRKLGSTPVDSRYKAAGGCRFHEKLRLCYREFLREVVLPLFPDAAEEGGGGLLYQREPNLRCHLPGTGRQMVLRHCDADYFHQPNELNFWLPLTPCYGTNTLWVESAAGRGDYRPVEIRVGQMLRFHGHQCDHFTLPNDTPHTRLSLDFRVVPQRHFLERYENSHHPNGRPRFGCGAFFAELADQ